MFVFEIDINKKSLHPSYISTAKHRIENVIGVYAYSSVITLEGSSYAKSCTRNNYGLEEQIAFSRNFQSYIYVIKNLFQIDKNAIAIKKLSGLTEFGNKFILKNGFYWYELFYNFERNERFLISIDEDIDNMTNPFNFKTLLCIDKENEKDFDIRHDLAINVCLNEY